MSNGRRYSTGNVTLSRPRFSIPDRERLGLDETDGILTLISVGTRVTYWLSYARALSAGVHILDTTDLGNWLPRANANSVEGVKFFD